MTLRRFLATILKRWGGSTVLGLLLSLGVTCAAVAFAASVTHAASAQSDDILGGDDLLARGGG